MIATYAAALTIGAASLAIGQAAITLCSRRQWSWLSPAIGFALLCALCRATVRLPGDGLVSAAAVAILAVASVVFLRGRVEGGGEAVRVGLPVALIAAGAASLPFVVEGHFGILGTGFDPDMSQHLLAADRLTQGASSPLLHQGYPLGPHAIVVALHRGLGIGIVQGFDGLTLAVAILAPLTALAAFAKQPPLRRTAAALLVGLPYLVASYYAQGAFKETIQALFVLAFALALRESTRAWRNLPLRFVPAATLAIGSIYVYSFPGLTWLAAIAAIYAALEWWGGRVARARLPAWSLAFLVFLIGALPELGRMLDFRHFETFDPNGPGLGNLFGQVSPFTALGIWPSGDFRLAPGDGAVPAFVYYLGAAFATALLLLGIRRAWRSGERAVLAGLVSVAALYGAARIGGTPYTAAKALEIAAPILTLTILLPLTRLFDVAAPAGGAGLGSSSAACEGEESNPATGPAGHLALVLLAIYALAAGACSLLAFANAPVGPVAYSPALNDLRPLLAGQSTLVLAPDHLLAGEHGERYIVWELRGGRICVEAASTAGGAPPDGIRFFVTAGASQPPFNGLRLERRTGPYELWRRPGPLRGPSPCPLIAVRQARAGDKTG